MTGEDIDRLRVLVPVMRELGVTEAWGVRLGPEPPRMRVLERGVESAASADDRAAAESLLRAARIEEIVEADRMRLRDRLGREPKPNEWTMWRTVDDEGNPIR